MLVSRMETVEMALLKANEYLYLHAYGVQVKMQSKGEYIQLKISLNIDSDVNIQPLMQLSVYHLALFVAGLLNVEVNTLPLHFSQTEPVLTQEQEEKQKHPLLFNQAFDGIQLKASQLAHKNHRDEQALNQLITHRLQKLQSRYPEDIADQVKGLIRHLLPTGECCIERIANALGMHHRSLQTQLKNKQQSYRSLLLKLAKKSLNTNLLTAAKPSQNLRCNSVMLILLYSADTLKLGLGYHQASGKNNRKKSYIKSQNKNKQAAIQSITAYRSHSNL